MAELLSATAMAQRIGRMPLRLRVAVWETALPVAGTARLRVYAPMAVADLWRGGEALAVRVASGLASAWPRIEPSLKQAWLAEARTAAGLRRAFQTLAQRLDVFKDVSVTLGLLSVALDAPAPGLIALLPQALEGAADAPVAEAAERTVLTLAKRWRELPRSCQEALDQAVAMLPLRDAALLRATPLLAALLAPPALAPRAHAWLAAEDEAGHMALRRAVRTLEGVEGKRWALRLLALPVVRRAAAEVVATPMQASLPQLAPLLADWHLLLHPERRRRLGAVSGKVWKNWLRSAVEEAVQTQGQVAADACRWLFLLGAERRRMIVAAEALVSRDAHTRSLAVRCLASAMDSSMWSDAARAALLDYCFDNEAWVAASAARALLARAPATFAQASAKLSRSPHASLRVLSCKACCGAPAPRTLHGPQPMWAKAASFRRALEADRDQALAQLRSAVRAGSLTAIRLAVRLAIVESVELELLQLLASGADGVRTQQEQLKGEGTRLVATAASALGFLRTQASATALQRLLSHWDGRVRANALESLARRGVSAQALRSGLADRTPRVRANACAALLERQPQARQPRRTLRAMLGSDAPVEQRRSALWVVERTLASDFAQEVAQIAQDAAGDDALRRRARRCARRLLASMACAPSASAAVAGSCTALEER